MDYSTRWYFQYAFPNTLPGSFCLAASSLMPGARDKDRIGEIISRSIALDAPHVVSALPGHAGSHIPLVGDIMMPAGDGVGPDRDLLDAVDPDPAGGPA